MSAIFNNQFTNDTHAVREERLLAIQDNWTNTATLLTVPAALATWATTAHTGFANARTLAGAETAEAEAATVVVNLAIAALDELYRSAHLIGEALFEDDTEVFKKYKFDEPYPSRRIDKLNRIRVIGEEHQRLVAASADLLMPTPLITQMTAAAEAVKAAISAQEGEQTEANDAQKDVRDLNESDSRNLRKLLLLWRGYRGLSDPLIGHIGMVNDAPPTGGGQPAAPTLSYAAPNVMIAAAPNTTSVDVERSDDDGATSTEIVSAENVTSVPLPQEAADVWARARARNANGTGAWSPWLIIPALSLAPILNFLYTMGAGFSWTAVGETIRLEASYDGGMTWNEIAFGVNPSGTYNWTPPAGMFRIRREAGGIVGPWSVITVTTP